MIKILANTNFVLTVIFLIFGVGFFINSAIKKREKASDIVGDVISAYFMANAIIFLTWR